jgi:hypothetical protein
MTMNDLLAATTVAFLMFAPAGCDETMTGDPMNPSNPSNPGQPMEVAVPPDAIRAQQGAVATVGDCRVGIAAVGNDYAVVDTFKEGQPETNQKLREGQLLVACGALHRVVGFQFSAGTSAPGGSGRAVLFDRRAAEGVKLSPGSVVLTVDGAVTGIGAAKIGLKELAIVEKDGATRAQFKVTQKSVADRGVDARAGDVIELGPTRHKILDVKAADAATGVPGWVEIEGTPQP